MIRTLTLITTLTLIASAAMAGLSIELRPSAKIKGDYVRLSEVAKIKGQLNLVIKAGRIFVGPAPDAEVAKRITRATISSRLEESGIASEIKFSGATSVVVSREGSTATLAPLPSIRATRSASTNAKTYDELDDATLMVNEAIAKRMRLDAGNSRIEVDVKTRNGIRLPANTEEVRMQSIITGRLPGICTLRFAALDSKGKKLGYFNSRVTVDATLEVYTTRRAIKRGDKVAASDFMVERVAYKTRNNFYLGKLSKIAGMQASRTIRAGSPLSITDLEERVLVKRGKEVVVEANAAGILLREITKAMDNGKQGDIITVESFNADPEKRRSYQVRVTGPGKAQVITADTYGREK